MAKIVFYCNDSISNIKNMEYYSLDIKVLEDIGHEVIICNKYRDIPTSFDAIYIYWWTYAMYPVLLAKIRGKPSYISGVFNYSFPKWLEEKDYLKRPFWQQFLMKWSMKLATYNLVTSLSDFRACSKEFRITNIAYTPCCMADEYFKFQVKKKSTNKILNIAWAGLTNLRRKGVFDIIEALKVVKSKGYDFEMNLAGGPGDGTKKLIDLVKSNGLRDQVNLLGEVTKDQKLELLRNCSIYVQPSNYEGFGLASAEAMAAGLAVISCDVGDVRNTLGDHASYVENGNISEIAAEIMRLLSKPANDKQIMLAKEFLSSKYTYERKLNDIKAIVKV